MMAMDGAVLAILCMVQAFFLILRLCKAVDWRWIVVFTPTLVMLLWLMIIVIHITYVWEVHLR